ncbi:MAG: hypothetical protein GEU75_02120 [Dehalococcoidia bacterium]|nr:hypothetical protein [Dehalococcoidia bacterium]
MELLLIPFLLITGAALLHLGVNGMPPTFNNPVSDLTSAIGLKSVRYPSLPRIAPRAMPMGPRPMATQETALQMTDVLLADLLTEMIEFREALAALKDQVETLAVAQPAPVAPRKRAQRSA